MPRGFLDSPWPYFGGAALLLIAALATQFEISLPSRDEAPIEELLTLRDRDDTNVVFLLIDTLRADRLGVYGYSRPTSRIIDEAARYGIVFDNVVSQSSWTKTSMASLWTATHPIRNGILRYNHVLPDEAVMPAELFQEAGYRTVGLWRNGWVEPNFGFAQGFEVYVRPTPGAERARLHRQSPSGHALVGTDEDMTISAVDFLDQFRNERFFLYLHYMDLHQYTYDEQAAIFGTSYSDAYDQSLNWTDRLVGALLQRLEDLDLMSRTLVVIASDHGEAFREHGFEGHARNLYTEVVHVPFIIIPPFLLDPGVRVPQVISNGDIWPTILDIVGLPELPGADGVSMLSLILEAAGADPGRDTEGLERPVFSHLARRWGHPKKQPEHIVSVTHGGMRLIKPLADGEKSEFYDRRADPAEQENLFAARRVESEAYDAMIAEYEDGSESPWGTEPTEVELDEMRLNHLRALGYVIKQ